VYPSRFPSTPYLEAYLRDGRITDPGETAQDMITRIVAVLAAADRRFAPHDADVFAQALGEALDDCRIVFSTPVMTNAGRHVSRPLAACAVPPVDLRGDLVMVKAVVDDYHRAGMGTGFSLDGLEDPVAILRYLNQVAVDSAASGGEDRPVGNMAILPLRHPRAIEFIQSKRGADARGETWKFNISLQVTDAQMRAAALTPGAERDLLAAAAGAAWECADPGLIFTDRMDQANPTPHVGGYVSTAPCAEVGLTTGETCQFGYLNLGRFHAGQGSVPVDLDALGQAVTILVRALDDAVEASLPLYPHQLSAQVMTAKRKIGVGVCGLADLLLQAELPYDSEEGRELARDVIAFVNYTSKLASAGLAASRGPCPAVGGGLSRYADPAFLVRFTGLGARTVTDAEWTALASRIAEGGMLRNSSTVALPPTGRSAPVIGASTGIEPLFRLTDPHHPGFLHPAVREILARAGHDSLADEVTRCGRLPDGAPVAGSVRALLAVATQIPPSGHLAMVSAIQACVDEAVAKTVNLPATAAPADVYDVFQAAWEAGCKGITVYRDGSRDSQPKAL
jgi:ribonucleoside-diphosphate reductase alpha chain